MSVCHKCPWGCITPTSSIQREAKLEACTHCNFEKMTPHNGMSFFSINASKQTAAEVNAVIERGGMEDDEYEVDYNDGYFDGMIAGAKAVLEFLSSVDVKHRDDVVYGLTLKQSEVARLTGESRQAFNQRIKKICEERPDLREVLKYTGKSFKKQETLAKSEQLMLDI